jgi:hypothetical protein
MIQLKKKLSFHNCIIEIEDQSNTIWYHFPKKKKKHETKPNQFFSKIKKIIIKIIK